MKKKEQIPQPTAGDIREGVMNFPGPMVTARAFKQSASFRLRSTSNEEFVAAINILSNEEKGAVVQVPLPRHAKPATIFIKKPPLEIMFTKETEREAYESRYKLPIHKAISNSMKERLRERGHLVNDD